MNKNLKATLIILGIAVALVVAGVLGLFYQKRSVTTGNPNPIEQVVPAPEGGEVKPTPEAPAASKPATRTQILAYTDALKRYADKRLQINENCQITPNNVTYKNGTTFMLDNRSATSKTVKIGSTYTIPAYSFRIVTLSSAKLPATYYIDCNNQQNSGTVTLQR